jgi:hypothetical protein
MVWTGMAYVIWFGGFLDQRYLLPVYPLVCLLTASTLIWLTQRDAWCRAVVWVSVGTTLTFNLAVTSVRTLETLPVVLGCQSVEDCLRAKAHDYVPIEFLNTALPSEARVIPLTNFLYYLHRDWTLVHWGRSRRWRISWRICAGRE